MRTFARTFASLGGLLVTKRITIKDVALQAGVSYQTVSKVINHQVQVSKETEDRIWKAVSNLGYHPSYTARSLKTSRSCTLGYSWPPTPPDQGNPILDQFLQSMFDAAESQGYYLLCFPYHPEKQHLINDYKELINSGRVDGFVISSVEYNDPRILLLLKENFPFVAFGRSNSELSFPYIDVDGGLGLCMATEHLLSRGHHKIAALAWPEDSRVGANRIEGYFTALKNAGIQPLESWVLRGEGRVAFGFQATQRLLCLPQNERPTAIVALNDMMAIGAIHAAQQMGLRVGIDLAITGFDDAPAVQYLSPPLTSLRQPIRQIGQTLINMLLQFIEKGSTAEPIYTLVPPQLIIRESSTGEKRENFF